MKAKPHKGDILGVNRGLYQHFGIYAGWGKVIHYTSNGGDFGKNITIRKTSIDQFCKGDTWYVCPVPEKVVTGKIYSPCQTVRRAKSQLGDGRYNILTNNCEHFVLWCKTGKAESMQVNNFLKAVAGIPVIGEGLSDFLRKFDLVDIQFDIENYTRKMLSKAADPICDGLERLSEIILQKLEELFPSQE